MTNTNQVIEETQEICSLCGGRGQEANYGGYSTSIMTNCRQCQGVGYRVVKRVVRTVVASAVPVQTEEPK